MSFGTHCKNATRPAPSPRRCPPCRSLGLRFVALLVLSLWLAPAPAFASPGPDDYPLGSSIGWNEFDPALFTRARTENRPLFLYFHGQWCTWCRDFQNQSLEHPDVVELIQRDFIPVLIDLDRRRDLFTRHGGRGLPFVVIVDERDEIRTRFTGHVGPEDLTRVLRDQRRQISATGRELGPSDEPIETVDQFLEMLDEVYDPSSRRLSGSALFGTLSKRPQPWTFAFLLQRPEWQGRMPGLLDQVAADLADPEDGGFFFFYDPDQGDPERARETSKRLDQNAAFLWLFADAYARYGDPAYRGIAERSLQYLRDHLWDPEQRRFYSSQYSDPFYYTRSRAERERQPPPAVDRTTLADASGQAIAALLRAAAALGDPSLIAWAGEALDGLERQMRNDGPGYLHALPPDRPAELQGYLPAQVWPAIAWHLYGQARGGEIPGRERELLAAIADYHDPALGGYRERLGYEVEPWIETRTQAALAWWLAGLPETEIAAAGIDPARVEAQLSIPPGADPDDVALGFWALDRR
jgi:uncharacterized protein